MPATSALPHDIEQAKAMAARIGYPLMLKASWGGGGRGVRTISLRFRDRVRQAGWQA